MKIVAISRVRNESDVIEAFVRHTATFVDHHLVLDNGSTDATRSILEALRAEGLAVEVLDDPRMGMGQVQAVAMNGLMRRAIEGGGEGWVIPLDADEFLVPVDDRTIRQHLAEHDVPTRVLWRTHVPSPDDTRTVRNPVERITHRLVAEALPWKKVMVPFGVARRVELEVGSHDVITLAGAAPERADDDGLRLCHFPVRNPAQWAMKVAVGNLAHIAASPDRRGLGFHYVEPFELLRTSWPQFEAYFERDAVRFAVPPSHDFHPELVLDPLPYAGGPLRYTPDHSDSEPWRSILDYSVQLAQRLGEASDQRRSRKSSRAWWARSRNRPA